MTRLTATYVSLVFLLAGLTGCGPSEAEQAVQAGHAAFNQLDFAEAVKQYTRAIERDSTRAEAYAGRGQIYWSQNRHAAAVEDLSRALALDPDQPLAHFYRGASRMMLQDFEGGVEDMAAALASGDLPPEDALRAHRFRSVGLMNLERYDEAIDDLTQIIALQPDVAVNYFDRGQLYEATNQPERALADYEQALEHIPEDEAMYDQVQDRLRALQNAQATDAS